MLKLKILKRHLVLFLLPSPLLLLSRPPPPQLNGPSRHGYRTTFLRRTNDSRCRPLERLLPLLPSVSALEDEAARLRLRLEASERQAREMVRTLKEVNAERRSAEKKVRRLEAGLPAVDEAEGQMTEAERDQALINLQRMSDNLLRDMREHEEEPIRMVPT